MVSKDPVERINNSRKANKASALVIAKRRSDKIERLGITKEELTRLYIKDNVSLENLAKYYDVSVGWLRKVLSEFDVTKSQKLAAQNSKKTIKEKYGPDYYNQTGFSSSLESRAKAQANSVISRKNNKLAKLASDGITYESVYEAFIVQNKSLTAVGAHFSRSKDQMRKILTFFEITKDKAAIKEAKRKGVEELYADPIRSKAHVEKTAATIKARYGNNWYRNTASKGEDEVYRELLKLYPGIMIERGSYKTIINPHTKHPLQLDLYLPELNFAIEFNGIYYHDKAAYLQDKQDLTCLTREALKDRLCQDKNIKLFHIWSDDWLLNPAKCLEALPAL